MDYLGAVSELNYMTQIVIMLYEDNNKVQPVEMVPVSHAAQWVYTTPNSGDANKS